MTRTLLLLSLLLLAAAPARAEEEPPVEISASSALEWNRTAKTYTASGDVVARRGAAEIRGESLTAKYVEGKKGTDITTITARKNVTLVSPPYTARGDEAVYDAQSGNAVLTGQNLTVTANDEKLTARDALRYDAAAQTLKAEGGATAVKGAQTLTSDSLTAHFTKGAGGRLVTQKITAGGAVTITTEKEVITGDAGSYDVQSQTAELTGNVRISQGQSFLEGTRATVDMKTGLSRLTGSAETGGRVKGVFYPSKSNN